MSDLPQYKQMGLHEIGFGDTFITIYNPLDPSGTTINRTFAKNDISPTKILQQIYPRKLLDNLNKIEIQAHTYDICNETGKYIGCVNLSKIYDVSNPGKLPIQAIMEVYPDEDSFSGGMTQYESRFFTDQMVLLAQYYQRKGINIFGKIDITKAEGREKLMQEIFYRANFNFIPTPDFPSDDPFAFQQDSYYFYGGNYFGFDESPEINFPKSLEIEMRVYTDRSHILSELPKNFRFEIIALKYTIDEKELTDFLVIGTENSSRMDKRKESSIDLIVDSRWTGEDILALTAIPPENILDLLERTLHHARTPVANSIRERFIERFKTYWHHHWDNLANTLNFHPDIPASDIIFALFYEVAIRKYPQINLYKRRHTVEEVYLPEHMTSTFARVRGSANPSIKGWHEKRIRFMQRIFRELDQETKPVESQKETTS